MSKIKFYNNDFLAKQRHETDQLADKTVAFLFESGQAKYFRKMTELLSENSYTIPKEWPDELKDYLLQSRQLPEWADKNMMSKGQVFFKKHASSLSLMLGLMSLPYDYAAANGAQVLLLSERLRYDTAKRLIETGKYVFDVGSPDGFSETGSAISTAQKVRLIHAAIRYHIGRSDKWNIDWGKPVNQEDMAGTNLSMSLIPIRGMRKLGIKVDPDTCIAYIHLWNVASYIMGVRNELLPDTSKEAFLLDKTITERQHQKSQAGVELTSSLLDYIAKQENGQLAWIAPKLMRFLLGERVADILDLPSDTIPTELLLSPLQSWNKLTSALQPSSFQTYYQAKSLYNSNANKINLGKKVKLEVPKQLK